MITHRERRARRRAYLLGRQTALRPPLGRNERVALVRRNLHLLSDLDRYAVLAELAISAGTEGMIRACALLLGSAETIGKHMPDAFRLDFAATINKSAERVAFTAQRYGEYGETLH